jgi:DNA repair exonuclease SbcCD nuclease subunit
MRLTIKGIEIEILGDPHLGRPFFRHVPLHRLGERQAMQRADFRASLIAGRTADFHVCVGDLFDRVNVANSVIVEAADDYAELGTFTDSVCLVGNHDRSRDLAVVSSFQLFERMAKGSVTIPMDEPYVATVRGVKLVFMSWHPTKNALAMVNEFADVIEDADVIIGHWDVVGIHETDNLIPAARLVELGVQLAVTGHDHNRRELVIDELPIMVTGSMQPYSHSEDPDEKLYVTRTLQQVRDAPEGAFKDNCLRVVLQPDDVCDVIVDCLMFQTIRAEEVIEEVAAVGFDSFDFTALWDQAFVAVDPAINAQLLETFRENGGEE